MSGIEESLANKLKARGVIVKGEILPDFNHDNDLDESSDGSGSEFSDEFSEERWTNNNVIWLIIL